MSIRTKLIAALSLIATVTTLGAAATWLSVQHERTTLAAVETTATRASAQGLQLVTSIKDLQLHIIQVQQWLTDISATRGLDGLDDGFTKAEEHARMFEATIVRAMGLAGRLGLEGVGQALQRTEAAFGPYYAVGQRMARGYVEGGTGEGNRLMGEFDATAEALATSMNDLVSQTDQAIAGEVGSLSRALAGMEAQASRLLWIATGGGLVALLTCITVGVAVGRGICTPLGAMTAVMHRLAEGDPDVAVPAGSRRDEIGQMAQALGIFKLNAVEKIRLETEQRSAAERAAADRRRTLADMADTLEQDVGNIVRTVAAEAQVLQGAAASMAASADQTDHQAQAVTAATQQTAANMQTIAAAAEELAASVQEIGRQVARSTAIATGAVDRARQANLRVDGLAQAAQKVGDVVRLIAEIAGQTNLLALNATIEAARAGEAGKGFAVVASEVKALATQTAKATDEISAQVAVIQGATEAAVSEIRDVGAVIESMSEIAAGIAAAVEQQGAATAEIAQNVAQASAGAREVSTNIAGVGSAAEEAKEASRRILDAASKLSDEADSMQRQVAGFLARVRVG